MPSDASIATQARIPMLERDQVAPDLQTLELTAVAMVFEFFPRLIGALRIP